MAYGYGQVLRGKPIYRTWYGQDSTGYFAIFLGAVALLIAVFPWGLVRLLWNMTRKKHLN
jgi:hypothetical protein